MRYLVFFGAIIGVLCVIGSFAQDSAPKQAALAALACAFAIIPYVIFRAYSVVLAEKQRTRIIELLEQRSGN